MKIILASGSDRRRRVLRRLGLKFEVVVSDVNEEEIKVNSPSQKVIKTSKAKAQAVAKKIDGEALVIAGDAFNYFKGHELQKPKTRKEAFGNLKRLSGRTHYAYAGIYAINTRTGKQYSGWAKTKIHFKDLTEEQIEEYLNMINPLEHAAGYNAEKGAPGEKILLAKIEGPDSQNLSFPVKKLLAILKDSGMSYIKPRDFSLY